MELVWLWHKTLKRHFLGLYIGSYAGKIYLLETAGVTKEEANLIRRNVAALQTMTGRQLSLWLKEFVPVAYKTGYRTLIESHVEIRSKYPLKNLGSVVANRPT